MHSEERAVPDAAQNGFTIDALVRETGTQPAKVRALYAREFADLEATATVRNFPQVLASRKVRAVLRQRHNE
jgi:hypothetical protein